MQPICLLDPSTRVCLICSWEASPWQRLMLSDYEHVRTALFSLVLEHCNRAYCACPAAWHA